MANNVEISKFQNLLAPNGGELSPKALLMLRTTKAAFEKLIADLVKKREAIQLKIRNLEDLDDYLLGTRYVPKVWVDKIFALELSLKKVNQDLVVARALYKEYFGVDDDGSTTSSTTLNPSSTTSSTSKNPSTTSTTTINNSSTSSSTTMNPSSTTSTTSFNPNSTTSSSTSANPSTTSSSTSFNPNSTTSSSTSVNPNTTSSSTTVQGTVTFRAVLRGNKEVPPNPSTASGEAVIVFNPVTKVAKLTVNFAGLVPSAAHIHRGAEGVAGPVLFLIAHAANPMQFVSPPLTAAQQVDLDNGHYYVNIHTAAYPDGEIRGQLVRQC